MTKSTAREQESVRPAPTLSHALDALDRAIADGFTARQLLKIGGAVTEISSSSCRLAGLSHFVRLGECVELAGVGKSPLCEVVRIDADGVTVKPFDGTLEAGL